MQKLDKSNGPGWEQIVQILLKFCEMHNIKPLQIKEKFGSLRFYYENRGGAPTVQLDNLIRAAEIRAEKTCEWCGAPGSRRNTGWIKTLCDEHEKQWNDGDRWWDANKS